MDEVLGNDNQQMEEERQTSAKPSEAEKEDEMVV
jgi:hypothetical protein